MTPALLALLISTQAAPATPAARAVPTQAATTAATTAATPKRPESGDAQPRARFRTPILSQGAQLASAPGFVGHSVVEPGLALFILDEHLTGNARRALTLMPSDPTDEVKQMLESRDPTTPWRFEASGTVYDYKGRAYLLPAAIVALRNPPLPPLLARQEPADAPDDSSSATPATATPTRAPLIDAYLDQSDVPSPLRDANAIALPHERGLTNIASTDDDLAQELERRLAQGVRAAAAAKTAEITVDRAMIMPAATRFQDRRAIITRDPLTGAWRAVLESAPAPGGQLAMELLPCRQLERIERSVKQTAVDAPWLLSGEIVVSGDRNFLLLTHAQPMPHDHWMWP